MDEENGSGTILSLGLMGAIGLILSLMVFLAVLFDTQQKAVNSADFAALEALPAVGHKTASVVMSQAFGIPAFPVDTHIHRLMYRWGLSSGKSVVQTERDAKRLFPKDKWNKLHLQLIWYGREYCPARGWKLEKDVISQQVARKSVLKELGSKGSKK